MHKVWWEVNDLIVRRTNANISGNQEINWVDYSLSSYLSSRLPVQNCLSLGCGRGDIERYLANKGVFIHCDGYEDFGEVAVQAAIREAKNNGLTNIDYHIVEMDNIKLPTNLYDIVWVNGALHHIKSLENVIHQVRISLKPDALFFINEYIGPNRFQFPNYQKEIINSCLKLLPSRYRRVTRKYSQLVVDNTKKTNIIWKLKRILDKARDRDLANSIKRRLDATIAINQGKELVKEKVIFPSVNDVVSYDPTLAVRSEEIIPALEKEFEIIEIKHWGGSILNFLLNDIENNFTGNDESVQLLLRMLISIEDTFLDLGELSSDFAYIVARPAKFQ